MGKNLNAKLAVNKVCQKDKPNLRNTESQNRILYN